ncbi:hypothetical protein IEN92_04810 [Polynucleobacter sp. MWH-Creno-3A4]|uniref:DUF6492 family protein n=1 Tax=Polynucleobacter sp. MWH-Creno-3A4 TaxID=1855886 RepID=UPI001C20E287|nr:DUF6492 family protein [Polynucleobacter sp. MWH-Creno-3A4]MBU3606068.1 hypothetical protein [Polynucleobacter sp. MWH-Creno-3A4]
MKEIVLYCKSYRKDFLRLKHLLDSIEQFNIDEIPFYISTPLEDRDLLKELVGEKGYEWVSDESIIKANTEAPVGVEKNKAGGLTQQVIKSEFWRLNISENYVCLDSDCIFIKDFRKSDFLAADGNPYTVIYQNKEYFQLAVDRGFAKAPQELKAEGDRVKALFTRQGPNYYCPCPPFIWSTKVWKSLDESFLKPRGLTFWDICTPDHPETLLYLEALLNYKAIPLHPIEQLFRIYYYDWHYFLLRRVGELPSKLKENYLGVIYQSSWDLSLDYGGSEKSLLSRTLKKLKRVGRYLQSFI